ncbi:MAG TPA: DHA2 family efflux MFS transporter permease subunit [Acidimicrobiales bacterium]|nr:DHA2 family efflux MFS transporter permease subunit [Acidimicrobiales bacterium]
MGQVTTIPGGRTAHEATGWRRLLVERRRPPSIAGRPGAHWLVLATVCIGAFMSQLDASIVTMAFPTLQRTFHGSLGSVTWVGLSYLLVLVGLATAVGRMADMVGRKLLYTYGFAVFIVGSALCGLAPDLPSLVGFRVLQGVGAAMLQANSVAILVLALPREKLGRGIGIQGAAQALGLALGPTVGGLLLGLGGWRLIFLVNVPIGLVGMVMARYLVPRSRELQARTRFDWAGLALFLPAVGAVLSAVSFGNTLGWASPAIVVLFAVAAALGAGFVRRERRAPSPMLDLSLFRRVPFSAGIASGLLSYVVLFGTLFVVPFYLERALGLGPGRAGLLLGVMPVALGVTAPVAGRFAERVGARPLTVAGMSAVAAVLGLLVVAHGSPAVVAVELVVLGVGLGMFTPPNNAAVMGSVPRAQSGVAGGVLNTTRGMGTAMGLAFTSLVFGAVAGSEQAPAALATRGFEAAAAFLGLVAVVAAVLAALRGRTGLTDDPVLTAE